MTTHDDALDAATTARIAAAMQGARRMPGETARETAWRIVAEIHGTESARRIYERVRRARVAADAALGTAVARALITAARRTARRGDAHQ